MSVRTLGIMVFSGFVAACSGGDGDSSGIGDAQTIANDFDNTNNHCVASGTTRLSAQQAYERSCNQPLALCAPLPDQWMCASSETKIRSANQLTETSQRLQNTLRESLIAQSGGLGLSAYILPNDGELNSIPQDQTNPLTPAKVRLGQFLFHDTGFALNGVSEDSRSWSCSTCHNAAAGFKAGIPQGIGEGGVGYGLDGSARQLALGFDPHAEDSADNKPDLQAVAPPATLNVAFQEAVLWNGALGNAGSINALIPEAQLATPNTPREENRLGMSGPETQAIAGIKLHRLQMEGQTPLLNTEYQQLWADAFPGGSTNTRLDAARAISSYVRSVISNRAPFQRWLRGDTLALNETELAGAILFFGDAGCSSCHQGPALSTRVNATESELFSAVGFADFDNSRNGIHGDIPDDARLGRGGFTLDPSDNYRFKIPQLYNLADATVFGHGASFDSIRDVIKYKNEAIAQNPAAANHLDHRFTPLGLSIRDISELTTFLSTALHDPDLDRYEPTYVPSGECITVNPLDGSNDYRCNSTSK